MNTNHLRHTSMMIAVGFLAAAQAAPLDKPGATVIKDASLAKAFAQATRQFTPQGSGFTAKNPSQPYSTTISTTGQMKLKVGESQVGISASAYGFGAQRMPISAPTLSSGKDKDGWPEVQLSRTGLSERYVNEGRGMHHWLSVASRPATANGNLWVNLSVTGAKGFRSLSQTAAEVTIGATKLKYAGLKVWDAAGRTLPARMETNSTGIGLVVTDANAKYPITIDPVWTSETKLTAIPPSSGEGFGSTVAIDGNVAAIGTKGYGTVYVFEKSDSGWTFETILTGSSSEQFGKAIAVHGDKIVIGAPEYLVFSEWFDDEGNWYPDLAPDGKVFLFHKQDNGWNNAGEFYTQSWGTLGSKLGASLALTDDYLVIGAPGNKRVDIYNVWTGYNGNCSLYSNTYNFGASISIHGNYLAVAGYDDLDRRQYDPGVSIYQLDASGWNPTGQEIVNVSLPDSLLQSVGGDTYYRRSSFGEGLLLTDTDLIVGDPRNGYLFAFNNWQTWNWPTGPEGLSLSQIQLTHYSGVDGQMAFNGSSLAYSGQTLFVGIPDEYSSGSARGAVYAFEKDSFGVWVQTEVIRPSDHDAYGLYGQSIAATASDLIVGWPNAGVQNFGRTGAAYVYALSSSTPKPTVTVTFPSLLSYGGTPGIYGSLSGKGLVTLSSPAPTGGTTLDLNSTSGHLTVPATVTVAAGETTAEFTFATEYVNSDSDGLVQASGTGVTGGDCTVKVLANKVVKISGVTLNSGGTGTGTVKLAVPAASDYTVYLASENPNLLYVPDSVTVPAGSLSAKFTVRSGLVSQLEEVYVSASPANGVKRAKFTIRPEVQISSVQLNDSVILAGTQTIGTVFLEGPAPAGGQVVALSSNRSAVSVPASVTVPEGMSSAEFSIQSTGIAATSATITAKNSNGFKKTATLNLVRPRLASIGLSQSTVKGGSDSPTLTVSLTVAMPFDVEITLSSNRSTLVMVPASITIPAGQLSASCVLETGKWTGKESSKVVTLGARYKLDSPKNVALTVTK